MVDRSSIALVVGGVSYSYAQRKALNKVSFSIESGQFTVLLGQNGAGKTTLYSLITGLYNAHEGTIRIFDHDVRNSSSEALKRLGVVFQQRTLDLDLSVRQNLHYFMALHGIKHHWAEERLKHELARMDLYEHTKERVRRLSGGQVRRVEIARALLHRPELMILDEPTVGLDIPSRQDILAHVRGLCREEGLAVLWATHLIDEVNLSDRVVILHKGRVVAHGGVEEVLSETGTENIREAFGKLTGISHQEDL